MRRGWRLLGGGGFKRSPHSSLSADLHMNLQVWGGRAEDKEPLGEERGGRYPCGRAPPAPQHPADPAPSTTWVKLCPGAAAWRCPCRRAAALLPPPPPPESLRGGWRARQGGGARGAGGSCKSCSGDGPQGGPQGAGRMLRGCSGDARACPGRAAQAARGMLGGMLPAVLLEGCSRDAREVLPGNNAWITRGMLAGCSLPASGVVVMGGGESSPCCSPGLLAEALGGMFPGMSGGARGCPAPAPRPTGGAAPGCARGKRRRGDAA